MNIDITKEGCLGFDKLEEFCDTFDLTKLIKSQTSEGTFKKYVCSRFPSFEPPSPPLFALVRFRDCQSG